MQTPAPTRPSERSNRDTPSILHLFEAALGTGGRVLLLSSGVACGKRHSWLFVPDEESKPWVCRRPVTVTPVAGGECRSLGHHWGVTVVVVDAENQSSAESGRAGVSRRSVVKAAAWAVPVIAVAAPAPAFAASPCTPTTSLDDLTPGTSPNPITFYPSLVTAGLAWTSGGQGGDNTPGDTGQVAATNTNPSWNYIEIEMVQSLNAGDYVQLTITLSEPVTGLSFILHDIDMEEGRQGTAWVDHVYIDTPGFTYARGSNIQGVGSGAVGNQNQGPFRPINWGDTPISSGEGDVRLTWPGEVSQVVIRYVAGATGYSQNQHIGLGDLRYEACLPPTGGRQARSLSTATRPQAPLSTGEFVPVESDGSQDL